MGKKRFPKNMKNFPFEHDGYTLWYSRSVAVGLYVYCKDCHGKWHVLAVRRGPGCPSNVGKWNIPCGYLDFGETTEEAARRECWEESGLDLRDPKKYTVHLCRIDDNPRGSRVQNVTISYYTILPGTLDQYHCSMEHCEPDEVTEIAFPLISDLGRLSSMRQWAFDHDYLAKVIFKKYVKNGWLSRLFGNGTQNQIDGIIAKKS